MATASPTQRARALYAMGRYALAAEELVPALADNPGYGDAHALMALCLLNEGKLTGALRHAQSAVAAWPDDSFCHYARACVLKGRGNLRQAAEACLEAVRLDPHYVSAWHKLGSIRLDQKNWRAAVECADMGLAVDPAHEGCATVRGLALLEMGRYGEADQTIQLLLAEHPDRESSHTMRGWFLLDRSRPREAMEAFREALRLSPTDPHARRGLAEARAMGNPLIRLWRTMERPLLKLVQRFPPGLRWMGALLFAVYYVGMIWICSTLALLVLMAVFVGMEALLN